MSAALAYLEHDLEHDLSPVQGLTVECAKCDPDNPRAVPQKKCPACNGSGRTLIALPSIVEEMRDARMELLVGPKGQKNARSQANDAYDGYVDPDDCCE